MKTAIRALTILAACAAAFPAVAADIPMKAPIRPVMAAPAFNWTGFYAGVHVGYARGDLTSGNDTTINHEPEGFLGGVQVGANWQWNWLVLGAEADISLTGIEGDDTTTFGAFNVNVDSKMKYLGTVRGRAGVAFDRLLVFIAGGYAYAEVDGNIRVTLGGLPVVSGTDTLNLHGWTFGGGVEGAITNNLTARVEYLYVDFASATSTINLGFLFQDTAKLNSHIVRGALNWKF